MIEQVGVCFIPTRMHCKLPETPKRRCMVIIVSLHIKMVLFIGLCKKKHLKKIGQYSVDVTFLLCMLVTAWFAMQVFLLASFKIPSDSMEPGLTTGDNILVWKPTIGPRIFNLFASMRNEQTEIYRIPGFKKIKRNDILVFNFPHPNCI